MAEQPAPERPSFSRDDIETVSVRRAPKYGVFLAAGAFVGVVMALILMFSIQSTNVSPDTDVVYSDLQVFGFTALVCVVVGVTVAAVVALVFERTLGGRTRRVVVDHEQHGV